jgi:outer membrane protein assembly factor BamE (lipoprotein component of BamABCDE complex)
MIRRFAVATACVLVLGAPLLSACTPVDQFQGYQAIDARPADVKVGTDTKNTVRTRLGSPSTVSTFDPNVWFYISQVTQKQAFYKARIIRRDVVAIAFDKDDGKVTKVDTLNMADGRVIAYNGRQTPTRGRSLSALEQILGTIGQGQLNQNQDINPGSRPGGR